MADRIYTATQKLQAVERELRYRERVYPRLISEGKLTRKLADEQLAVMRAIAEDYRSAAARERLI